MSYEGAMLGGYLLPETEFKQALTLVLQENKQQLLEGLKKVLTAINQNQIKKAYEEWDMFQTQILKNPTVDLLAVINWYSSTNQEWIFAKEIDSLHSNGRIDIQHIDQEMRSAYISEILTQHVSNLFKTLGTKHLTQGEIDELFTTNYSGVKKRFNEQKNGKKNYLYSLIIYGGGASSENDISYRGKAADAFVNHLGKIHPEIFTNKNLDHFSIKNDSEEDLVKKEEERMRKYGFLHLLLASLNNTGWWTGGDLIITDNTGKVIANIQLKTSVGLGEHIGQIKVKKLDILISQLIVKIELNNNSVIDDFYNALKTSVGPALGETAVSDLYELVEKECLKYAVKN